MWYMSKIYENLLLFVYQMMRVVSYYKLNLLTFINRLFRPTSFKIYFPTETSESLIKVMYFFID